MRKYVLDLMFGNKKEIPCTVVKNDNASQKIFEGESFGSNYPNI